MFTKQTLMTLRCQIRLIEARFSDEHKTEHGCYSFLQVIVKRCEMDVDFATYVNDAFTSLYIFSKIYVQYLYIHFILSDDFTR